MRDDNWLSEAPLDEWHGVYSDHSGRVFDLHLSSNGLSGEIPPELGNLSNLNTLYLYGNQLNGKIPPELGQLASLTMLSLGSNRLSGEIPPELGNLSNLNTLYLYGNQLNGKIPPELGQLASLTMLSLGSNRLSGEIPPELGNLSNLEVLNLADNQLSGLVPSELGNLHNISLLDLTGNLQLTTHNVLTSPPPTWIFTEDVPEEHRTILHEEMEFVRAYFSDRYGVEATGFTVLVGTSPALIPVYGDITNRRSDLFYATERSKVRSAWATRSPAGGAVVTLVYGTVNDVNLIELMHAIVHEYFHVLQGQLATGFAQLENGETAYHTDLSARGPKWLIEGLAEYAEYVYSLSSIRGKPYLYTPYTEGRNTPYKDLARYLARQELDSLDSLGLTAIEDYRDNQCYTDPERVYTFGFVASVFLVERAEEDSYIRYWRLLGERPTWQQAFEEAFGIDIDDFHKAFDVWIVSQLPPPQIELKIQLRWPEFEPLDRTQGGLHIDFTVLDPNVEFASRGTIAEETDYVSVVYTEGIVWTAYLALWYRHYDDACTDHLLGWYKDGELTNSREDATPFTFTGTPGTTVWYLPGQPDTLPSLEEQTRYDCQ